MPTYIKSVEVQGTTYPIYDSRLGTSTTASLPSHTHDYSKVTVSQTLSSGTEVGKITVNNNGTSTTTTLYAPTDTDTKVAQVVTTTNSTYPLLFCANASQAANVTTTSRFGTLIHANPGTGRVRMNALVVGQSTTANYSGWTTTVPTSTTNAVTGQVMFVIGEDLQ